MTPENLKRANDLKQRIDNLRDFIYPETRTLIIWPQKLKALWFIRTHTADRKQIELTDPETIADVYGVLGERLRKLEDEFEAIGK